jgi:COP9 signalosome complex subunit 7
MSSAAAAGCSRRLNHRSLATITLTSESAAALEQFCVLAKNSKGKACVALIHEVLKSDKVLCYGAFLQSPNVLALRGTEHHAHWALLQLFAYGTYADYKQQRQQQQQQAALHALPELSASQLHKLKLVSLISLASASKSLAYSRLLADLDIGSVRELEDLVIECIYHDMLDAKLDQRRACVEVAAAGARDVSADEAPALMAQLQQWYAHSLNVNLNPLYSI